MTANPFSFRFFDKKASHNWEALIYLSGIGLVWRSGYDNLFDDGVLQNLAVFMQPGTGADQAGQITARIHSLCPCGTALAKGAVAITSDSVDVSHTALEVRHPKTGSR